MLAGALAAITLNVVCTIEGALREGYQPASDFISELSLGPRGFVQKLNFLVVGCLLIAFAYALGRTPRISGAAAFTFALIGIGLLGAGVFDTDEFAGAPLEHLSTNGALHMFFALFVFGTMPAASALTYASLRGRDESFARVTLAAGAIVALLLTAFTAAFPWPWVGPLAFPALTSSIGWVQRVTEGAFFAWTAALSLRLFLKPA